MSNFRSESSATSMYVISTNILFAGSCLVASSFVTDFNTRHKLLTQKLLNKAIGIINFAKHFLNFIDDTMI